MPRFKKKPAGIARRPGPPGPPGLAAYPRAVTVSKICDVMALGFPLAAVLQMPGMPTVDLVMKWQRKDPGIRRAIMEARELAADAMAEECLAIADGAMPADVGVAKLRVSTRLRLASAWAPQTYGRPEQLAKPPVQVVIDFARMGVRVEPQERPIGELPIDEHEAPRASVSLPDTELH